MTIKRKKKNRDEHISKYICLFAYAGRSKAFYEEPMTRKTRIHGPKIPDHDDAWECTRTPLR